jgi:alanine racemase
MGRAATITINFEALRHNYRLAKRVSGNQKTLAIIKADAYGHGAIMVARALSNEVDGFGVACIEEAVELREAGINKPILLLEGFFTPDELNIISELDLWTAIHSEEQVDLLSRHTLSKRINVWLKMDCGMHRLGIKPERYNTVYQKLNTLPQVNDIVLMSHFSSADELDIDETKKQVALFDRFTKNIPAQKSLANSAATLGQPCSHKDWQRPGLMLYGATPFTQSHPNADQLQSVMTLSSEVIAVHHLEQGDAVGYSKTFVCDKATKVGTVAMGYADGYPRHAKCGTPVLVNGQLTRTLGRVSMDMLAIDLTNIEGAETGAYVELWGENLPASEVATYCDTIPYTLFTGITRRVHKAYTNILNRNSFELKKTG